MSKRTSFEIKRKILICVKDKPLTFAELERKVGTGYRTVKSNCDELKGFSQVRIDFVKRHPANGRKAYVVSITEQGVKFLKQK